MSALFVEGRRCALTMVVMKHTTPPPPPPQGQLFHMLSMSCIHNACPDTVYRGKCHLCKSHGDRNEIPSWGRWWVPRHFHLQFEIPCERPFLLGLKPFRKKVSCATSNDTNNFCPGGTILALCQFRKRFFRC